MHQSNFTVRSTQVDTFGHLNSCRYLELYEWARWQWWAAQGIDLAEYRDSRRRAPMILRAELDFKMELRLGDPITIRTWLHEANRVKATFVQEMVTGDEGPPASVARIVFVLVDLDSRLPVPMPREIINLTRAPGN